MTQQRLKDQFNWLRQQIRNDNTLDVLDELLSLLSISTKLYNEALLQHSRYARVEREFRQGLITRETATVDKNRINAALIQLLDDLENRATPESTPIAQPTAEKESLTPATKAKPEKILGVNNLKQISWVAWGLEVSKSVCRIHAPSGLGSGFLVAPNLLMTNNHVIGSANEVEETTIEFNYQQRFMGGYETSYRYRLDPTRFHTSSKLDYTLVGVASDSAERPLEHWGILKLNPNANPVRGELVCIVQHPNGGLKQITMTANWVMGCQDHILWYTTDTMPGSSGSPVFNDLWQVIGIHHAGGATLPATNNGLTKIANEGILMSHIKPDAESAGLWPVHKER